MSANGGGLTRSDVVPAPRSLARASAKAGAVFGGLIAVISALMAMLALEGVPGGDPRTSIALFGLAWGAATGLGFGLFLASTIAITGRLLGRDHRLWNVRQESHFETGLSREAALGLATRALRAVAMPQGIKSDLGAGTATGRVLQPTFFATRVINVSARVVAGDDGGARVEFCSAPGAGRSLEMDYGSARTLVDTVAARFEALAREPSAGANELGLEALPAGALELLRGNGDVIGGIHPAGENRAALCVSLFDERGGAHEAVVVLLPETMSDELAARAAREAGGGNAAGGEGFILVAVREGTDATRVALGVHQYLLARQAGYRGALRADVAGDDGEELPLVQRGSKRYGDRSD